jgi:hypothetical protein
MAVRILDPFGRRVTLSDWQAGQRDVTVYEVSRSGDYRVTAVDLGHGQLEASAVRGETCAEVSWSDCAIELYLESVERHMEETVEERSQAASKRAGRRAAKRIRQLCKANEARDLLTLTYRANETDLRRVKRDLKEFHRRVERVLPGFGFVGAFEEQKRGAWHVHAAIRKCPKVITIKAHGSVIRVKSYDLLRSIWRSVTGARGGNVDVSAGKGKQRSSARIAAYIAKYATKSFSEGEKWSNRWTKYGFDDVPDSLDFGCFGTLRDAVESVYGFVLDAQSIVTARLDRWKEWFFMAAESS